MTPPTASPSLERILAPIHDPLQRVETLLLQTLEAEVPLLSEIGQYILKSGGKRIRPAMLLLASGTLAEIGEEACRAAGIMEYLHTATLLHDDVVDNADLRRSQKTARIIWGNEASVLVGDYLLGTAFKLLASLNRPSLIDILADTATIMARGEIIQLSRDPWRIDETEYLDIIYCKTASLMGAAMRIGAILGNADSDQQKNLEACGINIGMAFQLVDDALDYDWGNVEMGKQAGTDLKEKKITLPLSHLLQHAEAAEKAELDAILAQPSISDDQIARVCALTARHRSCEYTLNRAGQYIEQLRPALASLPDNECRRSIEQLGQYIITRKK